MNVRQRIYAALNTLERKKLMMLLQIVLRLIAVKEYLIYENFKCITCTHNFSDYIPV